MNKPSKHITKERILKSLIGPSLFLFSLLLDNGLFHTNTSGIYTALGITAWVLVWWTQQNVPIIITSILPLILFSLTGIIPLLSGLQNYYSPIIMLFLGGFLLGLMLEKWKLHEKLAIYILQKSGNSPSSVVLGMMLASYFISMWISNTATAIMMLPIAISIFKTIDSLCEREISRKIVIASLLGIAYGANIGGTATLIGTPPNIVLKDQMQRQFGNSPDFLEWMLIGLPFSLIFLAIVYFVFVKLIFKIPKVKLEGISEFVIKQKLLLGKTNIAQKRSMWIFGGAAFCWITAQGVNHLLSLYNSSYSLTDHGIAIFFASLAFVIPSGSMLGKSLLSYKELPKVSWPILVMFGGGMTLAKGLQVSGVIDLIGVFANKLPENAWIIALVFFIIISVFLTELMSNVALITILLPITFVVSKAFGIEEPLIMAMPVTIGASLAFMMPIATPPNAVVFSSKMLPINTMMTTGFWLNIIAVVCLFLLSLLLNQIYD